jgi:DNA uptake protein ComE-like DNA-binding protein
MQSGWKSYFIFSKKEQRGIMVLGIILLGTMLMGILFPRKEIAINSTAQQRGPLFYFDPNTIDSITAILLGIPSRQVITLMRYRNKGGRFYRKEDIAKLYGLKKDLVEKLIPYVAIKIFNKNIDRNELVKQDVNKNLNEWSIDINISDEKQWAAKTKLSPSIIKNIMRYRNYLGGFTNLNQMKKVYGFTEANYYLLKPHFTLGKMNHLKPNASNMSFENWKALGLFQDREIAQILRIRKEKGAILDGKNWSFYLT